MKTIVIGGGPAGLMAAGSIKYGEVMLVERNEKTGKKLYITGKGRCNVTNDILPKDFIDNVVSNPKFLLGALNAFSPSDTVSLIESMGVPLKFERGGRVFPESDKASDITKALTKYAQNNKTEFCLNTKVNNIYKSGDIFVLEADNDKIECDNLILATGGVSYPTTGSDGDGYKFAKRLGHNIIQSAPALVPIRLKENVSALAGLSLKNVKVTVTNGSFTKEQFGEMLFTHHGVSGPVILSLSSYINRLSPDNKLKLCIDLKPALSEQQLDARILSDFDKQKNKLFKNSLFDLLPNSLIGYIIEASGIPSDLPVNSITKQQRTQLLSVLKTLTFTVDRLEVIEAGIVTAGGVDIKEINPKTMESKIVKGLYFAGEIMDIDALTGGYNIQIALSTGYVAGSSIKEN